MPNSNFVSATMMPRVSACAAPAGRPRARARASVAMRSRARPGAPASSSLMLTSWPLSAFVDGVKIGSRQPVGLAQARRAARCRTRAPVFWYSFQPEPDEVAAHDALDRDRLGAPDQHRPAAQHVGVPAAAPAGYASGRCRRTWFGTTSRVSAEPERGQLRQHLALVGDARPEDVVERRDAVGRDDEQVVAGVVEVAHLAAAERGEAGKRGASSGAGTSLGILTVGLALVAGVAAAQRGAIIRGGVPTRRAVDGTGRAVVPGSK